jgi:hypothetical protein
MLQWEKHILTDPKARDIGAIHQQLLEDLQASKVSRSVIKEVRKAGPEILRKKRLPPGVLQAGRAYGATDVLVEKFDTAQTAFRGMQPKELAKGYKQLLAALKTAGVEDDILAELRTVSPVTLLGPKPSEVLQALSARGKDGVLTRVWNTLTKRSPTPQVPEAVLEAVASESGPATAAGLAGTTKALAGAGVRGFSKGARAFRALGRGPGLIGIGASALMSAQSIYNMASGNQAKADEMALRGGPLGGPGVRSSDVLRQMLQERDALARRKLVAVTQEPQLTQQVIQAMMGDRPAPSTLTRSEMRVGAGAGQQMPGKSEKDTMELVEALLSQMGS